MGIFKRSKDDLDFEFETSTEHTPNADETELSASQQTTGDTTAQRRTTGQSYGIEDAIALMRKLPNVNSEITITVVKKTLESANIQVDEIISDAERKESEVQARTDQLAKEISELQNRIERLNGEITELTADLKETSKVKSLLLGSAEPVATPPKAPAEAAKKPKEENVAPANAAAKPPEKVALGEKS